MSMSSSGEREPHRRLMDRIRDKIFDCWDEDGFHPDRINEPLEVLLFWAARICVGQADNGGLYQFFVDYSGVVAPEAVKGLRMLSLEEGADVLLRAMAFFGEPYPISHKIRQKRLAEIQGDGDNREEWDPFDELDDEFFYCASEHFDDIADRFAEPYL